MNECAKLARFRETFPNYFVKDLKNKQINMHPKKFALFGNIYQAKKSAHVLRLLSILEKYQAEVYIHKDFYQFLTQEQKMDIQTAGVFEGDNFEADMVLSMGGDGTFLKAASHVGKKNIPILGINTGRLGFLADVSPEEMEETFEDIYKCNYKIEDRSVLQAFSDSTRIKKVRCKNQDQKPIEIINCDFTKRYLCTEDYLMAIVWEIPPKKEGGKPKYEAIFVRRDQIGSDGKPKNVHTPHPAAKKVCQIYKNDYLEFVDNGSWYKCRVAGYSATKNQFDIRPIYATTDSYDWLLASQSTMTETCWKPQKSNNYISVNVLFGEKQARRITVNPIGRVFKKK